MSCQQPVCIHENGDNCWISSLSLSKCEEKWKFLQLLWKKKRENNKGKQKIRWVADELVKSDDVLDLEAQ